MDEKNKNKNENETITKQTNISSFIETRKTKVQTELLNETIG